MRVWLADAVFFVIVLVIDKVVIFTLYVCMIFGIGGFGSSRDVCRRYPHV